MFPSAFLLKLIHFFFLHEPAAHSVLLPGAVYIKIFSPFHLFSSTGWVAAGLKSADTDLCLSNLWVEHFIEDDETIRGVRCVPFDQHRGRLGHHYLMGHGTWDVICFLCESQTQRRTVKENHMVHNLLWNLLADEHDVLLWACLCLTKWSYNWFNTFF